MSKQIITNNGIVTRKSFWQRLWCGHDWNEDWVVDYFWGLKHYTCLNCGKQIETKTPPISWES